jgi:hypothetical protein
LGISSGVEFAVLESLALDAIGLEVKSVTIDEAPPVDFLSPDSRALGPFRGVSSQDSWRPANPLRIIRNST